MNLEEFEQLVDMYKQTKEEYWKASKIATLRQDDEYAVRTLGLRHKLNSLYDQIEYEIMNSDDERIKSYFTPENGMEF